MSQFEVRQPILNSPYHEPEKYWLLEEGEEPREMPGRRPAAYFYRDPRMGHSTDASQQNRGIQIELKLVNLIRARVKEWRAGGYQGVSGTTLELIQYWRREGRRQNLFFAQLEAAETIIFLTEARGDFKQGIAIPRDEPSEDRKAEGYAGFLRYACKMATGSGKTTVMGMLAAWSILNKVQSKTDARFSDLVLIVCPNVTIRDRLQELDVTKGEASLFRTRDLVPPHLMADLSKGKVLVTNWHVFEPREINESRVGKAGRELRTFETIRIADKTTTARGSRYLSLRDYEKQVNAGMLRVLEEERDKQGNLIKVKVESCRYVESDTALVRRVLGKIAGGKQNILVMNDEAHHAYRIRKLEPDEDEDLDDDSMDEFFKEATVWVDGLDRVQKLRGINFCLDLSATPYFLGRVGNETNRIFPWTISEFGLTDAIESGLVKIPQLAVRDSSGADIPGYFNIWQWILPKLTPSERGASKASPKPEAILKWAHTPIAMLGGLWDQMRASQSHSDDPRPPVFILVCKNTKIAKSVFDWMAEDIRPSGIPSLGLKELRNLNDEVRTIRVDSKVVQETDSGTPKSDESRWMRFILDTVGRRDWPSDSQGSPIFPDGFADLAEKLQRPLHPPGRDIRCIVSVGMLTEGWDCNTVTHIVGLRPFMSQLLCEQVVGRGLRRTSYDVAENGLLSEEVVKVFGVPFEVVPFKANEGATAPRKQDRRHIHPLPSKAAMEIIFPRVEGYQQEVRNRIAVDWATVAPLEIDTTKIPSEVQMKGALPNTKGKYSLHSPGVAENVNLDPYRADRRMQALIFKLAADLTRVYRQQPTCEAPPHVLFPQLVSICQRYLETKVIAPPPANRLDAFISPYYGWLIERLGQAIKPETAHESPSEIPKYEQHRGPGSTAEVSLWTSRPVVDVVHSHLNAVVADTKVWEQSAAFILDNHSAVAAFAKNAGLGFGIPYIYNGLTHDYIPDFLVRFTGRPDFTLILETKGYDPNKEVKRQAAERWVAAVNADQTSDHTPRFGTWAYAMAQSIQEVQAILDMHAQAPLPPKMDGTLEPL